MKKVKLSTAIAVFFLLSVFLFFLFKQNIIVIWWIVIFIGVLINAYFIRGIIKIVKKWNRENLKPIEVKLHWAILLRKKLLINGSWKWNAWVRDYSAWAEVNL